MKGGEKNLRIGSETMHRDFIFDMIICSLQGCPTGVRRELVRRHFIFDMVVCREQGSLASILGQLVLRDLVLSVILVGEQSGLAGILRKLVLRNLIGCRVSGGKDGGTTRRALLESEVVQPLLGESGGGEMSLGGQTRRCPGTGQSRYLGRLACPRSVESIARTRRSQSRGSVGSCVLTGSQGICRH